MYVLYFCKMTYGEHQACLKVFNKQKDELSIAADDSCGVMRNLGRIEAVTFKANKEQVNHGPVLDAEQLLRILAKHLGYGLRKNSSPVNNKAVK